MKKFIKLLSVRLCANITNAKPKIVKKIHHKNDKMIIATWKKMTNHIQKNLKLLLMLNHIETYQYKKILVVWDVVWEMLVDSATTI